MGRGIVSYRTTVWLLLVLLTGVSFAPAQSPARGQNIAPAYEGFWKNADGSFDLLFGYYNRNWEEEIDVPIGPGNFLSPGTPDQGQPTHSAGQPMDRARHV